MSADFPRFKNLCSGELSKNKHPPKIQGRTSNRNIYTIRKDEQPFSPKARKKISVYRRISVSIKKCPIARTC